MLAGFVFNLSIDLHLYIIWFSCFKYVLFLIRKAELNGYHCMYRFVECIAFYLLHVYKMTMAECTIVYYCVTWRKLNWPK